MNNLRGACIAELPWNEVEARLVAGGATLILTIGSGSKEQGHHLQLDTNQRQAMWLGLALACRWLALMWPPKSHVHCPTLTQYPGSVSIAGQAFMAPLEDVVMSIRAHTDAPSLIINTGISTITPIEQVANYSKVTALHVHRGTHLTRAREHHCRKTTAAMEMWPRLR